jgi:hypothetical protein
VTIVFTRSRPQPSPPPPPINIWLDPKEVCRIIGISCPDYTPRPPYFMDAEYPKKDDYAAFLKWLRKSPARHIDLKPFIEGAIDSFNPPHGAEEKGAEPFERAIDATIENGEGVRQRTAEAPGNPDAPDEETEAPPTKYRHIQRPLYQQN